MFDIDQPSELFAMLRERFQQYRDGAEKSTEDAIFMILVSNHLREWIAPKYSKKNKTWRVAKNDAERFSRKMYDNENFEIVRTLANGVKHLTASTTKTLDLGGAEGLAVIGRVGGAKVLKAIPAVHYVDGKDLTEVLGPVIELYGTWFERP
jgi:hypothetical protein